MTENITAMDEARFKELAASYGGDLAQWPRGTKASARLLLRQKPALVGTLAAVMEDQGTVKSQPAGVPPGSLADSRYGPAQHGLCRPGDNTRGKRCGSIIG